MKTVDIPGIGAVVTSDANAPEAASKLDGVIRNNLPPPPELKEYEIWMEGYRATGESGTAQLLGRFPGRSFRDACHRMQCIMFLQERVDSDRTGKGASDPDRWDYDGNVPSIWACKLYDNEEDARKAFG